ncbi:MAG: phosphatidate cytidylyltransferase [Candidatus Scatovivens sp.]
MNKKRILTTLIYFPLIILLLELNKPILIDILISIVAIRSIYEFTKCAKEKNYKIISWIGYILAILIAFREFLDIKLEYIFYLSLLTVTVLFLHVIISNGKITFEDISYTLFGIIYIIGFSIFIPIIYSLENGKLLIWFVFFAAWGTDTFAYIIGCRFGKHKFSKISPNKSIEGCIGGTIGALIIILIYTLYLNCNYKMEFSYLIISIMAIILSIISQIGDFSASVIKRHFGVKDFSNLFPGHGGMIDRIDSVIFIAPFAYFFITNLF